MGQQNSCNILIGALSIVHLMHPIKVLELLLACLKVRKMCIYFAAATSYVFTQRNTLAIATVTHAPAGKSLRSSVLHPTNYHLLQVTYTFHN